VAHLKITFTGNRFDKATKRARGAIKGQGVVCTLKASYS
jgi:hypothetical protein